VYYVKYVVIKGQQSISRLKLHSFERSAWNIWRDEIVGTIYLNQDTLAYQQKRQIPLFRLVTLQNCIFMWIFRKRWQ